MLTKQMPLYLDFMPLYSVYTSLRDAAAHAQETAAVQIACVRDGGDCDTFRMDFAAPMDRTAIRFCERVVKFMLWASGGYEICVSAPEALARHIADAYSPQGARAFDCETMETAYGRPLTVRALSAEEMPAPQTRVQPLGGHLNGCRLGFDLGASDFKISAVNAGETVFADEIPWTPVTATDPDYHFNLLQDGLKKAAAHLPRVDAIGGSSAGVIVDNQIKIASLIRGIQGADRPKAQQIFKRVQEAWGVPVEVANDGDVTALAGALSLKRNAILGIAMGSSEAVGYIDRNGQLTGRLNELAFAPVDFNPDAAQDEWSQDNGVGAMYFSQQAVNRLAVAAGFAFPDDMPLPERLKVVQAEMADGGRASTRAANIYTTIGTYLGYAIPWYRVFYDFGTVLLLGRVTSGKGGEIIVSTAQKIMRSLNCGVELMMPDEKARRVGQCVAAASLPRL
ncbi:MAG: ROK family protein [Kiritimatiellaeota bacterium]|nr:ROK family protein [Kiritimatiellota bacterium]